MNQRVMTGCLRARGAAIGHGRSERAWQRIAAGEVAYDEVTL